MSAPLPSAQAALHAQLLARLTAELQLLPDKPEETPASALAALWLLAAGERLSVQAAAERTLPALDAEAQARLHALVAQRLAGTPLAHITGRQRFMGLEMLASPQALIPRRETELLATAGVALLRDLLQARAQLRVVDVCTGSGNVAAALAAAAPGVQVHAADLSEEAVALARENVAHLGLAERVALAAGDLLAPFDTPEFHGQVDLLTCNPPYISNARRQTMAAEIAEHEPSLAFDGGPLGVRIVQRLIREAPKFLRPGGWLVFEVGAGQGPAVMQRLKADWSRSDCVKDDAGEIRVVMAQRA